MILRGGLTTSGSESLETGASGQGVCWHSRQYQSPDMTGHIKVLDPGLQATKPTKIVTGGEDFQTIIHKGLPFRRVKSNKTAHRGAYINCLRFSPDGTKYCSVASDKKVVVYDAEDSSAFFTIKGHTGGVCGCDWTADGASIFTCSADTRANFGMLPMARAPLHSPSQSHRLLATCR